MDLPGGAHTINCKELFMDAKEDNAMTQYNKITALYSRSKGFFREVRKTGKADEHPPLYRR